MPAMGSSLFSAPLTYAQRRFWNLEGRCPGDPSLRWVYAVRIQGEIDLSQLGRAVQYVVTRHPATRSIIRLSSDGPWQHISSWRGTFLQCVYPGLGQDVSHEGIARWVEGLARKPLDLSSQYPFWVSIMSLASDEHVLALCGHVIVSDGWSKGEILKEISWAYDRGEDMLRSVNVDRGFFEYADYERKSRDAQISNHLGFWRNLLGIDPLACFPTRRPPCVGDGIPAIESNKMELVLDKSTVDGVGDLVRCFGATHVSALVAIFLLAVSRWSGSQDIALVLPTFNRALAPWETSVGCFADSFVLRMQVALSDTLLDWCRRVGRVMFECIDHAALPYDLLLEMLYPGKDRYDPGLFPLMFSPQPGTGGKLRIRGTVVSEINIRLPTLLFNLHVFVDVGSNGARCVFCFRNDVLESYAVGCLATAYETAMRQFVQNPNAQVEQLLHRLAP